MDLPGKEKPSQEERELFVGKKEKNPPQKKKKE